MIISIVPAPVVPVSPVYAVTCETCGNPFKVRSKKRSDTNSIKCPVCYLANKTALDAVAAANGYTVCPCHIPDKKTISKKERSYWHECWQLTSNQWGRKIRPHIRIQVGERDNWICHRCAHAIDKTLAWPHPLAQVADHYPICNSHGGSNKPANIRIAHSLCNGSTSRYDYASLPAEQIELIRVIRPALVSKVKLTAP